MSTTLAALLQEIAKTRGLGYLSGTCSAAGATTTIVDTSADSPFDPDDRGSLLEGSWAKIESDTAGTPLNVGEVRRIKAQGGYTPNTGTVTVGRGFSNATTTTQSYGIYLGVPPATQGAIKGLTQYVNDALRKLQMRTLGLLTLVSDGDMEASGTTSWTATSATLSKVTSSSYVFTGKQALRVLNSGASGYARSGLIPVAANQSYDCLADVRVSSGTATLQLYDETNAAEIDSASTAELRKGYLYLTDTTIPSGCQQISVRLVGTESNADVYWDNVSLRDRAGSELPLPSWVIKSEQVEKLVYRAGGFKESTNDSYDSAGRDEREVFWHGVIEDFGASTPFRVLYDPAPPQDAHLWAQGLRYFPELSADTDTTDCDKDWLCHWVRAAVFADLGKKQEAGYWGALALSRHRAMAPRWRGRAFGAVRM